MKRVVFPDGRVALRPESPSGGGMTLRVSCVDARREQKRLAAQWRTLTEGSARGDLATSGDWFWNNLDWISPPRHRLSFVTVQDGELVIGLFPVEVRSVTLSGINVRCAGFIHGPYALCDTAVVTGDDVERSAHGFVSFLFDEMRGWECFSTDGLDTESRVGRALISALSARGKVIDRGSEARPYIAFTAGWPGYLESRSANFRRNLRRAIRDLTQSGNLDYRSAASGGEGMDLVESIDRRSWRMAKQKDVATNTRLVEYCRNLQRIFPDPEAHVVRYLTLNDVPVASLYGFIHANVFYGIKVNYDVSIGEGSPGFVLLTRAFEELAVHGIERIELLGRNEYLRRLGSASHSMSRMLVFNRSPQGRALGWAADAARKIQSVRARRHQTAGQE